MAREGIGFVAGLDPEQRARYYYWWRKYLLLKYVSRAALLLSGASLLAPMVEKSLLPLVVLFKPAFFVAFGSGIWWAFLDCPRCGQRYRWGGEADYFGDDCQHCGLTEAQLSSIAKPR